MTHDFPPFDPAVSDGCSGGVRQHRRELCVVHDQAYWHGRTWLDKWRADWRLGWGYVEAARRDGLSAVGVFEEARFGFGRFIGVLIGGNRAFWDKPHKARLSKWRVW